MSFLKFSFTFSIVFLLLTQNVGAVFANSNLQRFGIGWGYVNTDFDVFSPIVTDMGVGWYTDWSPKNTTPRNASELASKGIDRLTLVLTAEPFKYYSSDGCNQLKNLVSQSPNAFKPERTYWSVGNELGYDPGDLTANRYASEFISWRDCIKSIDSKYKVGSGAVTSMWVVLPRTFPISCTDISTNESGRSYFRTYVNRIKSLNSNKLPDFIVMHAYNTCYPSLPGDNSNISKFKNAVITYRETMKELGLQNKELWIKEFNGSNYGQGFLNDSFEFLLNAKDKNLGFSGDDFRLVQRFAWFQLKNTPNGINSTPQVLVSPTGVLTSNGQTYKRISRKYAGNPSPPPPPTPPTTKKPGDANGDGEVNAGDFQIWKANFGLSGGFAKGNFNSDGVVDGLDYVIWFGGFGK